MSSPFGKTSVPTRYQATVLTAAVKYGVPPALLAAQIDAESGFNPNAVSPDGAIGIAQFLPGTAADTGVDPHDPVSSINGMAKLMAHYYKTFGTWQKALYAYHDGPGAVSTPGPAGIRYAQTILNKVGDIVIIPGPVPIPLPDPGTLNKLTDPFVNVEKVLTSFTDPTKWRRVG